MRTAIYVYESSTVTIRMSEVRDQVAKLYRYEQDPELADEPQLAAGTHQLERGIYRIISNGPVQITGVSGEVVAVPNDKDDWPDPKPNVVALEPGASAASIQAFFPKVAKDESPGG